MTREHKGIECNCEEHKWPTHYNSDHDCYFCPECDMWIESQCSDPECEYCVGRPEKPSQSKQGLDKG